MRQFVRRLCNAAKASAPSAATININIGGLALGLACCSSSPIAEAQLQRRPSMQSSQRMHGDGGSGGRASAGGGGGSGASGGKRVPPEDPELEFFHRPLAFSVQESKGHRPYMEDTHKISPGASFCAVFDGAHRRLLPPFSLAFPPRSDRFAARHSSVERGRVESCPKCTEGHSQLSVSLSLKVHCNGSFARLGGGCMCAGVGAGHGGAAVAKYLRAHVYSYLGEALAAGAQEGDGAAAVEGSGPAPAPLPTSTTPAQVEKAVISAFRRLSDSVLAQNVRVARRPRVAPV